MGEASYATIAPTVIDDMSPPEKKGRWLSTFYLAIPIGSALGYVIGGLLGKLGWRPAFWVVGIPGILAALSCLLLVEPERKERDLPRSLRESVARLAGILLVRRLILGYAAQTFAVGGFAFWGPKFLVEAYDLPIARASTTFGIVLVVAGGLGTWIGGGWADRQVAKAGASNDASAAARIELRICATTACFAAPLAAAAFWAPSAKLFFLFAFFCEAATFASAAPANAALLRSVPPELRASAMALSIFSIHFFGDLWSPLALGALRDALPSRLAMMGLPLALAVGAGLWILPREVRRSALGIKRG